MLRSEFIVGDVAISPPHAWQVRFYASNIEVKSRIDNSVDLKIVDELYQRCSDFRRAYDEGRLTLDEFDSYGPTRRTLRQFIASCADLNAIVRDVMLPKPDH